MSTDSALTLERDLIYIEVLASELKNYLLSDGLYWPLQAGRRTAVPLPRGTLGGFLLRLRRLDALEHLLTPEQVMRLHEARSVAYPELDQWAVQAEEKALREMRARVRGWRLYIEECQDNPDRYAPEHSTQAEGRTIISLLLDFLPKQAFGFAPQLHALDADMLAITTEGDFIWNPALEPAYPPQRFWWLYVRIKTKDA